LADQFRSQREEFEKVLLKSSEACSKVLEAPSDDHHHKVEAAKQISRRQVPPKQVPYRIIRNQGRIYANDPEGYGS
jgi:hypothetical protein